MNPMISSITREFALANNFNELDVPTQFEHLVNYLVVHENYNGSFDVSSISTGEQELGIDGIATLVTGQLIQDPEEVDDMISASNKSYLDVQFIFSQAKTGARFDSGEISKMFSALLDFFSEGRLRQGEMIQTTIDIKNRLYAHPGRFRPNVPSLKIYYATTGEWVGDLNLLEIVKQGTRSLNGLGIFRDVEFIPWDRTNIRDAYYASLRSDSATLKFKDRVSIPSTSGVRPSYLGVLSAESLIAVVDNGGKIKEHLFFDNMRDFQDSSRANSEIESTLKSEIKNEFILLNNGITIVSKKITQSGDDFVLEDFQIVNGCQTTHVLYNNRDLVDETVYVPLKLIWAEDETVVNRIIRGTNTSNAFDDTQLWATDEFHKLLETYFNQINPPMPQLAYERRKGQHRANQGTPKTRIIEPKSLLKAASAIYDKDPQDATKYVSKLYPKVGRSLFRNGQDLYYYYVAGLLDAVFNELLQAKRLDRDFRPCRYHMIMAVKLLFHDTASPNGRLKAEVELSPLVSELGDFDRAAATFRAVGTEVRRYAVEQGESRLSRLAKMVGLRDHLEAWATEQVCHLAKRPQE